jgi:anti-sigma factor ChrR (cupin superfamily)
VVTPDAASWAPSPEPGVERLMLDRDGAEVARATSVVRFAPDSRFARHTHGAGEEFLVLSGTFSDETGDYPAGTYVRNPPGTSHAPRSEGGCTLFVKLRQFAPDDLEQVVIDTRAARADWFPSGEAGGIEVLPLHAHGPERVTLERWAPGTRLARRAHPGGAEFLVLEGSFADGDGAYPAGSWLRLPPGSVHAPRTDEGCLLYVKTGHLGAAAAAA